MFRGRVEETNAAFSNQFVEQLLFYTSHEIAVHDRRSSGGGVGETAAPLPRVDWNFTRTLQIDARGKKHFFSGSRTRRRIIFFKLIYRIERNTNLASKAASNDYFYCYFCYCKKLFYLLLNSSNTFAKKILFSLVFLFFYLYAWKYESLNRSFQYSFIYTVNYFLRVYL